MNNNSPLAILAALALIGLLLLALGVPLLGGVSEKARLEHQTAQAQAAAALAQAQAEAAQARTQALAVAPLAAAARTDTALTVLYAVTDRLILGGALAVIAFLVWVQKWRRSPRRDVAPPVFSTALPPQRIPDPQWDNDDDDARA